MQTPLRTDHGEATNSAVRSTAQACVPPRPPVHAYLREPHRRNASLDLSHPDPSSDSQSDDSSRILTGQVFARADRRVIDRPDVFLVREHRRDPVTPSTATLIAGSVGVATISEVLVGAGWGWLVLVAEGCGVPVLCGFRSGDRFGNCWAKGRRTLGTYQTHNDDGTTGVVGEFVRWPIMAPRQAPIDLRIIRRRGAMPKRPAPNPATIVLAGLMLLALAVALVMANNGDNPAPQADEIVFEPEVVELEVVELEGSATLKVEYAASPDAFESSGQDDISLTITPGISEPGEAEAIYHVEGVLDSTQSVAISGLDAGAICWFNIFHRVQYAIHGDFRADPDCRFELFVVLKPKSSEILSTDCSVGFQGDVSWIYMAPLETQKLVFTKSWANPVPSQQDWSLLLVDVALPPGVYCPSFDQ